MARYLVEKTIAFGNSQDSRLIIADGSLTVSVWDGESWIESDKLTSGSYEYFTRNVRLKLTPDVGSSFFIDEEGK